MRVQVVTVPPYDPLETRLLTQEISFAYEHLFRNLIRLGLPNKAVRSTFLIRGGRIVRRKEAGYCTCLVEHSTFAVKHG